MEIFNTIIEAFEEQKTNVMEKTKKEEQKTNVMEKKSKILNYIPHIILIIILIISGFLCIIYMEKIIELLNNNTGNELIQKWKT